MIRHAALLFTILAAASFACADDLAALKSTGKLLLDDKFERDESTPDKEEIGNGWTTNSAWRAQGKKQVDLDHGAMVVKRVPEANHGVAIFHDVAMRDGAVQLKFKLAEGDDLGVDFVDRELKTVHAGHLCMARVTLKSLTLVDSKTGGMDLKIKARREAGDKDPELAKLLKSKAANFSLSLKADDWHELLVVIQGDVMRANVDGKQIGEFKSEGIAHPTKRMITLAVNKNAMVDELSIWAAP